MKQKKRSANSSPIFYLLLAILTCTIAVALVLLSGDQEIPASAKIPAGNGSLPVPDDSESLGASSNGVLSVAEPFLAEESSGTVSFAESELSTSREYYNPSVSSPKSTIQPGTSGLSFTEEEKASLDALLNTYAPNVSVFYQDIGSGSTYEYNGDKHYFIASLIKAPYSMYLYQLTEQGKCDLNELLTVTEEDKQEGTGTIKDMEDLPKQFTVRELIALAIRQSDNTAMKVLLRKYPAAGYHVYAKSLGMEHTDDVQYVTNGQINSHEAGLYLRAIYDYIENGKYGGELKADMLGTSYVMIQSAYPVVRKYGWAEAAYHDMAIVYAPHPYLLAICTDHGEGKSTDRAMFAEISKRLESLWTEKYNQSAQ